MNDATNRKTYTRTYRFMLAHPQRKSHVYWLQFFTMIKKKFYDIDLAPHKKLPFILLYIGRKLERSNTRI